MVNGEREAPRTDLGRRARILLVMVGALWVLEIVDLLLLDRHLDGYGIRPRQGSGLLGIVFAPFLHLGFGHLLSNTLPLLILGFLVALRGFGNLFWVSVYAALVGGLGVWLIGGDQTVHVGSSILIFGWWAYLIVRGFTEKSPASVLVALAVGFIYGGLIFGVLPGPPGVSWQGHLFGAVGGALAAWSLGWKPPAERAA